MTNSIRHDFHSDLATLISDDIQYQHSGYYYFLGKVEPWGIGDLAPDLMQPDSDLENTAIRTNMLYVKRINPNDVTLVTKRYDWVTGSVFSIWDHTKNMKDVQFYCVTTDNNVYKCLDNAGGGASTVKPYGNSVYAIRTTDGYLWKYMYNIPAFKRSRFSSLNYIPVQRALTDSFYNKGAVESVVVSNVGSGYTDTLRTYITVTGTTTGTGASASVVVGSTGNITSINLISGGTGYTAGVDIGFTSASGTGGVGTATVVGGVITAITINSAGVGYVLGNLVTFTVGGAVIVPVVSRLTGSITSVKILKSGVGYSATPTITVGTSGTTGSGKYGNATALLTSVIYQGRIVGINIIDPGILYSSDTATNITVQGDGTGASFSPVIYNGTLIDVVVENTGTGYSSISLVVTGMGTGAVLTPLLSTSDFISDQSIVEQTTVSGAIYAIQISNSGNNYSTNTIVNIVGDGTGCVATPVIVDGAITHILVSAAGSGYTYGNVTFTDNNRQSYGDNVDAVAYTILPPIGGHGHDAISELFGDTLGINSSLRQDESLKNLFQDYRQFGIIKNPTDILTGRKHNSQASLITYSVVFDSVVGLVKDEILLRSGVKFRVVSIVNTTVNLQQLGIKYVDPLGTMAAENENTRIYNSSRILTFPVVNKYSGKLIYTSNENPFSFTEDQGITIKTFLQF